MLGLWPSDGLTRRAFEVKVSRADFLNELDKPLKNSWVRKYFHEFWFVAPAGVIKEEELPEGDGWLCPRGDDQLTTKRHASRKVEPSLDNTFLASLARSMGKANEKYKEVATTRFLEESSEHQRALRYQQATERYLKESGQYVRNYSGEDMANEVFARLQKSSMDTKYQGDYERIKYHLEQYQETLFEMYDAMTALVFVNVLETDEMGERLHKYLADKNSLTLSHQRARTKKSKKNYKTKQWSEMLKTFDFMKERIKKPF